VLDWDAGAWHAACSRNDDRVVYWRLNGLDLWRPGGEPVLLREGPGGGVTFSPDDQTLGLVEYDGSVSLFDLRRGETVAHVPLQTPAAYSTRIAFSPDGRTLAIGRQQPFTYGQVPTQGDLLFYDLPSRSLRATRTAHHQRDFVLGFAPAGDVLLTQSDDGVLKVWDVARAEEKAALT
jgi:WD40 repeat protein